MIPLRRLTTIVMPHRGPRASLRKAAVAVSVEPIKQNSNMREASKFRSMSAIQILKYGLKEIYGRKKDGYSASCIVKA